MACCRHLRALPFGSTAGIPQEGMMRKSAIARLIVMSALAITLLVPLSWVRSIVTERTTRRDGAVAEVSGIWGGSQVIGGPVLSVPYTVSWIDGAGRLQRSVCRASFLPRDLQIDGSLVPQTRNRGIFEIVVYRTELKITGRFARPDVQWIRPAPEHVDWDQAALSIGVTDSRGLTRRASLKWRGQDVPFAAGTADVGLFRAGIQASVPVDGEDQARTEYPFEFVLELNGTRDLRFLPAAEETSVTLTSTWPHPSFSGTPLPEIRRLDASGFNARWRTTDVGRPFASRWTNRENPSQLLAGANASSFGVSLVQPVDIYQQVERAVKYAVLFIVLTFLVFFLWEIFHAALLHPMQYAFIGFALCVFYLLLVSLSEHAGFDVAYAAAASVTTLLIAGYARAVLGGMTQGASVLAALAALYGFLYLLLRLEDYALLAGSVGLFVILAFVMYVTRRMSWYELKLGGTLPE
jgi:inner membrane protein